MNARVALALGMVGWWGGHAVAADRGAEVRRALGIQPSDVLSGSVLTGKVLPGDEKQVVAMTTFFTGKKDEARAVDVRLDVFRRDGERLASIYSRSFGDEGGGFVGRGEVQLIDLDLDGVNEIVVTWEDHRSPLVQRRAGEVILHDPDGFRSAWTGDIELDATRAARDVPPERRDRFRRELDVASTLKTRGVTLFFKKRVEAVAGDRLPQPKIVTEMFPLRPSTE